MGTKKKLAKHVAEIATLAAPGSFVDLFSGMCSVAKEISATRQIWTNDLQKFAHEVALAHFCCATEPLQRIDAVALVRKYYSEHIHAHMNIASSRIYTEENYLKEKDFTRLNTLYQEWHESKPLDSWQYHRHNDATLFRDLYAGSYVGLIQAIEIDGLRYAFDTLLHEQKIDAGAYRWMLLALGVALSKCATSTGHFAQPLTPKPHNVRVFVAQRKRSIWDSWTSAVGELNPVGNEAWRASNRAFREDAVACLQGINLSKCVKPAVVYADPPYTTDQYSRYYHIYETLLLYDYPSVAGKGRYRPDRAVSSFSMATKVECSIENLISKSSELGADLIISYPTNGLLKFSREVIPDMVLKYFGKKPQIWEIPYEHSTMGASKGAGKQSVVEVLYRAYH